MNNSKNHDLQWLGALVMLMLVLSMAYTTTNYAQGASRLFPETGKTIKGIFMQYWNNQGGLSQQGFQIFEQMQEVSDANGKSYTRPGGTITSIWCPPKSRQILGQIKVEKWLR